MNAIDVLVIILLCLGTLVGFFHGLLRTVFHVVLLYGTTVIAAFGYPVVARGIGFIAPDTSWQLRQAVAFLFLLLLVFNMVAFGMRQPFKQRKLLIPAVFDKIGGMVVGFFLSCLWIGIGLILADFLLSVSWVNWEPLRYYIYYGVQASAFAGLVRGILPYALETLKPWFAAFGGLPQLFVIR